ncbi:hypothetical protein QKW35_21010 [Pontibacterium granulatum]|uniref:hypothetical protein n=1 Tax=Pontibacterium granulatum TaxID=2036029 RepID=UPI002499BBFF|nr:hypothetical protein [Pontibacterium granulatum]MDI3326864.1 hypothetical protein [Pontibacterium granulatum]
MLNKGDTHIPPQVGIGYTLLDSGCCLISTVAVRLQKTKDEIREELARVPLRNRDSQL